MMPLLLRECWVGKFIFCPFLQIAVFATLLAANQYAAGKTEILILHSAQRIGDGIEQCVIGFSVKVQSVPSCMGIIMPIMKSVKLHIIPLR